MRSSLILIASLVAFSGCIIHSDKSDTGKQPPVVERYGDITFEWSLGGLTCGQAGNIKEVRIRLTGARGVEALQNGGYYPCNTAGVDGIKLKEFAPGDYNFTIDALSFSQNVLYTASGSVYVDGNIVVRSNLVPVGGPGRIEVFWTFNGRRHCAQSGLGEDALPVNRVVVTLNGDTKNAANWPCSAEGIEGIATDLEPGTYNIQLDGYVDIEGEDSQLWYSASSDLSIEAGALRKFTIDLDPVAASATFMPVLRIGGQPVSCAGAGAAIISAQLIDSYGNPTEPFYGPCDLFASSGFLWPWLLTEDVFDPTLSAWTGDWTVRMEAWDAPASNHRVVMKGETQVTVVAGWDDQVFPVNLLPVR